jgi:S1-C subfamily serine protease
LGILERYVEPNARRRFPLGGIGLILIIVIALAVTMGDRVAPEPDPTPEFVIHSVITPTPTELREQSTVVRERQSSGLLTDAEQSQKQIDAVAAVAPAVISVRKSSTARTANPSDDQVGSGVIIDASGLAIASLRTTGSDGDLTVVLSNGESAKATIVRVDEELQLVLLQIEGETPAVAKLAAEPPRSGERVLAIGTPLGDFSSTVTAGVIGAIGVTMPAASDGVATIAGVLQHDAATNRGSEGGPLINLDGEVVAIDLGSISTTVQDNQNETAQGWSFAVPVSMLGPLIGQGE